MNLQTNKQTKPYTGIYYQQGNRLQTLKTLGASILQQPGTVNWLFTILRFSTLFTFMDTQNLRIRVGNTLSNSNECWGGGIPAPGKSPIAHQDTQIHSHSLHSHILTHFRSTKQQTHTAQTLYLLQRTKKATSSSLAPHNEGLGLRTESIEQRAKDRELRTKSSHTLWTLQSPPTCQSSFIQSITGMTYQSDVHHRSG